MMLQQPGQANFFGGFGFLGPTQPPGSPPPVPTPEPIGFPSAWSLLVAAAIYAAAYVAYRAFFAPEQRPPQEEPNYFLPNQRELPPLKEYPPLRQEFLPYLQYLMIDPLQVYAAVAGVAPESMNDLEGAKSRSRMTDEEIQAAGRAAFHLGAGWGGFSFTNEGGIATINSQGQISWSSTGQPNSGQAHFSSGEDALAAIANLFSGRNTTTTPNTPTPTPTQEVEEGNND